MMAINVQFYKVHNHMTNEDIVIPRIVNQQALCGGCECGDETDRDASAAYPGSECEGGVFARGADLPSEGVGVDLAESAESEAGGQEGG